MDALEALHGRCSFPKLRGPGPADEELENIFRAALRAADHGVLRPWRFLTVRGKSRRRLGELMVTGERRRNPALIDEDAARLQDKPLRAPLIIVVISSPKRHPKVPISEQEFSAAAAAQNILLAAHAQGLGAMWRTGAAAYDEAVMQGLGLAAGEKIIGFIYIGTIDGARKNIEPPDTRGFYQEW